MTYVIGDIRGRMDKYESIMEKINPDDLTDYVYVLGNILGGKDGGLDILKDMSLRGCVFPLLGEQEYYAKKVFPILDGYGGIEEALAVLDENSRDRGYLETWLLKKGGTTMEEFMLLDQEDRESIMDYLEEFESYMEIEVEGRTFVLTSSGIKNFSADKDLEEYSEEDFIFAKNDYSKVYFDDKYLVSGHTPTKNIDEQYKGKIYSKNKHIAVDCGCGLGGRLACFCLDTLKAQYA